MQSALEIITIVSSILLVVFILVQTRGASLGAGFGGSSEIHTARRGVDKSIHQITIILALAFVLSIVTSLFLG
ncbi:preprotein translocase subunit SecG [Candidatus Saccharibacteria bacterium]|jgi:preprotein translocase subunit SecG|nr:preprotein translocase subunit SecG [Candidatus Saccharibacteria bacterium]MBP9131686.1 preprotein translocase subunit SecG [Candidatus Saccharibacteria bacterium]